MDRSEATYSYTICIDGRPISDIVSAHEGLEAVLVHVSHCFELEIALDPPRQSAFAEVIEGNHLVGMFRFDVESERIDFRTADVAATRVVNGRGLSPSDQEPGPHDLLRMVEQAYAYSGPRQAGRTP